MQSACHVASTNRGKTVCSSYSTTSVSCREAISLDRTMLDKVFEDQEQLLEVNSISISIMSQCFP